MRIITVGIDLAKNVFAVHGDDEGGKAVLVKPKVSREQLSPLVAQLPPCTIGMEACSGAHHWARLSAGSYRSPLHARQELVVFIVRSYPEPDDCLFSHDSNRSPFAINANRIDRQSCVNLLQSK